MQRLVSFTLAPAAAVVNNIALAQAVAGAGNLNLNGAAVTGGVATLDMARRVGITSAGNDTARTFTITGTDRNQRAITESLKGANAGVAGSLKDFLTITNIAIDGAAAGNVTVGTTQTVSSQWVPVDRYSSMDLGVTVEVGATAPTYTVEHTMDDPYTPGVGVLAPGQLDFYLKPYPCPTAALVGANTSQSGAYSTPITAIRLTLTAFAAGATAKATFAPGFMEAE